MAVPPQAARIGSRSGNDPRSMPLDRGAPSVGQDLLVRARDSMRRVVVTGVGVVAPNGVGKEAFWSACLNGRSGVGPIRSFDASQHPVKIAGEVSDFDVTPFVPPSQRKSVRI